MRILIFIFLCCLLFGTSHAEEGLSLVPYVPCNSPPRSPPKSILEKQYRTYMPVGLWHTFDINGDGLCDWIRNGRQGYRSDIDVVPMREMIYLGTPSGWRHFETKGNIRAEDIVLDSVNRIHLHGFSESYGFYQPIPIYRKNSKKPYVIAVSRTDAAAPPPDVERINVFEWDEDTDNLRYINGKARDDLMRFVSEQYCASKEIPQYDGEELIIVLGNFCK